MAHAPHSVCGLDRACQGGAWSGPSAVGVEGVPSRRREVRIANAILDVARAEAECLGGAKLLRVGVNIGVDCQIDMAALDSALKVIRHGTDLEDVALHLRRCARRTHCGGCGREAISEVTMKACPECASPELELVGGDELELSFIEVER